MTLDEIGAHFGVSHQAVWKVTRGEVWGRHLKKARERRTREAERAAEKGRRADRETIVRELHASGLNQQEIARRTGLSQQHVSRVVRRSG